MAIISHSSARERILISHIFHYFSVPASYYFLFPIPSPTMAGSIGKDSLDKSSAEDPEKVDALALDVPTLTPEEEKRAYRKIDLRCFLVLPLPKSPIGQLD
jgi:hypothetical protein